ncbi:phosphatase PAP2 family protein [Parabacteroides sp. PF5-9]|uniref:phosphatase PAP2 family protein n=1 Tax=Parabacteroides sp. PF5-9 TaxID=1742404 RepID=UPI002476E4F7|nr:phosphatase PAP2 family protein [Parabacteroides sp. PF5-9]MDH6358152.1 membrane-associated phospholipid phosphatase [Parabacteroides sp. PF5-9]
MKQQLVICLLLFAFALQAQQVELSGSRKAVKTSSDIMVTVTPLACITTVLLLQDWEGMKQGAFAAATTIGVSYALKYLVDKERPDRSDNRSFPSLHTSVAFTGATFIQKRYGWKWGIPAYVVASYVGWSRTYAKKHDWWDVAAGAVLGVGSGYLFTRPFADKYNLSVSPVAGNGGYGIYASLRF